MKVIHPLGMVNNNPPENVFIAVDESEKQYGLASIVYQYQPHLFPDRPHTMYIDLQSEPAAQYLLFGALMGRAQQLWHLSANPQERARVYTQVSAGDREQLAFWEHNGFDVTARDQFITMDAPVGYGRDPMGCSPRQASLNTPQEQIEFICRMQQNGVAGLDQAFLGELMRLPHFLALGMLYNTPTGQQLVGEILMAGEGSTCEVLGLYVTPEYRRQGMGTVLLHRGMAIMAGEGVTRINARILSNSEPQCRLFRRFDYQVIDEQTVFPSMYLEPMGM